MGGTSHVVSMFQHFESFLRDLIDEHPASSSWPPRDESEPLSEYVLKHVTGKEVKWDAFTRTKLDILDHYRKAEIGFGTRRTKKHQKPKISNRERKSILLDVS
jgi:hypothetical protein